MSQERTEAIVLRGVDFGETSRIVTFLAPDRGRLACMVQGARRPKSGLGPVLDTFNHLELVYYWKDGRSVQKLGDAALLNGFAALKADLDKAVYAAFPLEVAYKVAQENEPSHGLFAALVRGLEDMGRWAGSARTHAAWQVWRLMTEAGLAPAVIEEGPPGRAVGFSYDFGMAGAGARADRKLSPACHGALRAFARCPDSCPARDDAGEAFDVLRGYAVRQLDAEFRSLRVIDQMFR
ncbi:MAG: DNA repair protein RecO [Candidatus Hydrogenedentes bacterium]|nr:DNA repair protein RecO [Candidatus Hydrogenedentota bacterium]